ncbi:MAG TPA: TIGR00730 family Rossman fold protein [Phycisphaerales bacterium]|nr:TIGR00730 family Rossman fold protein [Phycisphaerales bacterium]
MPAPTNTRALTSPSSSSWQGDAALHTPQTPHSSRPVRRIAVFCGASAGGRPDYTEAARELGETLAAQSITVVYGGGRAGLMGTVADAALARGGSVIGVITKLLQSRELAHHGCTELHVVETMHERKMMMATLADAFIALPGGLGTLDELFEILAWAQLGIHAKPVGLLNTCNYYDKLWAFMDHVESENFLRLNHRTQVLVDPHPADLTTRLCTIA